MPNFSPSVAISVRRVVVVSSPEEEKRWNVSDFVYRSNKKDWIGEKMQIRFVVPSMEMLVLSGSSAVSSSNISTAPLLPCFFFFVLEFHMASSSFGLLFDDDVAAAFLFAAVFLFAICVLSLFRSQHALLSIHTPAEDQDPLLGQQSNTRA
jgi:hypothetical protein